MKLWFGRHVIAIALIATFVGGNVAGGLLIHFADAPTYGPFSATITASHQQGCNGLFDSCWPFPAHYWYADALITNGTYAGQTIQVSDGCAYPGPPPMGPGTNLTLVTKNGAWSWTSINGTQALQVICN